MTFSDDPQISEFCRLFSEHEQERMNIIRRAIYGGPRFADGGYFGKWFRLTELREIRKSAKFRLLQWLRPTKERTALLTELEELETWAAKLPAVVKFRRYNPPTQENHPT